MRAWQVWHLQQTTTKITQQQCMIELHASLFAHPAPAPRARPRSCRPPPGTPPTCPAGMQRDAPVVIIRPVASRLAAHGAAHQTQQPQTLSLCFLLKCSPGCGTSCSGPAGSPQQSCPGTCGRDKGPGAGGVVGNRGSRWGFGNSITAYEMELKSRVPQCKCMSPYTRQAQFSQPQKFTQLPPAEVVQDGLADGGEGAHGVGVRRAQRLRDLLVHLRAIGSTVVCFSASIVMGSGWEWYLAPSDSGYSRPSAGEGNKGTDAVVR